MQSKATTVEQYIASLPADRRAALSAVRKVILANLDKDLEEGMQYGMIGYYVPHRVFPAGYHCDPKQPLPYAGLASQKNYMSVYLMSIYDGGNGESIAGQHAKWFQAAWAKSGKKLDMGKCCVRFKKLEDLALDVVGQAIKRVSAAKYIAGYQANLALGASGKAARAEAKSKPAAKPAKARKTASKTK